MLGNTSGFAVLVTHFFLHRRELASKTPTILKQVLFTAVKVVNFIKVRTLNNRFSRSLAKKWEQNVKFFSTIQRFGGFPEEKSSSACLNFELFFREKEIPLSEQFDRNKFIHGLAYLADIFGHMKEVNLSI